MIFVHNVGIPIAWCGNLLYNVGVGGVKWGKLGDNPLFPQGRTYWWGSHCMFLGQFSYTLDSKGRLTIPSRFREGLLTEVVVTRGMDRCLVVYPIDAWKEISEKVTSLSITDSRARSLRRQLFADAINLELDRQGRILIPDRLREYAGMDLSSGVVIVGLESFIELWDPERWNVQNDSQMETVDEDPAVWESLQI